VLTLASAVLILTAGAEVLVRGASALAIRAGVSPLFVGLTVVGFGTSAPELSASLVASAAGSSDVAVGNVVGSNVFNVAVILGVTALVRPIRIHLSALRRDVLVAIAAAAVPWLALTNGGVLSRGLGLGLLAALALYLGVAYRAGRRGAGEADSLRREDVESALVWTRKDPARIVLQILLSLAGIGLLAFGARLFVETALGIARAHDVPEVVVGLTIVAMGTSLPELVTSIVAAVRGSPDIAVGNVVGSSIFNILGILGLSASLTPQVVSPIILARDTPVMLVATVALVPLLRTGGVLSRREGGLLLLGYLVYLAVLLRAG